LKIVFATGNENKATEVRSLLPPAFEMVSLNDIGFLEEIPETCSTLHENAFIKAKTIFDKFGLPVFADDTGLEVDFLNGAPGVYSARYAGENATYAENCEKLLAELENAENRNARFRTVFCYINAAGAPLYFEGQVSGWITTSPSGTQGFGYDPVFRPDESTKTFAEMDLNEKNMFSHRSRALKPLIAHLSGN
jgi:XTP/dITP diphosphohydrolase